MSKTIVIAALSAFAALSARAQGSPELPTDNEALKKELPRAELPKGVMPEAAPPKFDLPEAEVPQTAEDDGQIAAIVLAAHEVDLTSAALAERKARSPDVKTFAKHMSAEHLALSKQTHKLCTRLMVKPEENVTSKALREEGKRSVAALQKLRGAAFDLAYMDQEIRYHEQVLSMIDETLIPNTKNAELKELIVNLRPTIAAHLEHARSVQHELGAPGAGVSGAIIK